MILSFLNFSISLDGSPWLLFLLFIVSIIFSYIIYKQTTPPVKPFVRTFLFSLRSVALVVLLAILFHPILSIRHNYLQKPDIAVLIDNSRSLQIEDANVVRSDIMNSVLKNKIWEDLQDQFFLHFFPFSNSVDSTFNYNDFDSLSFRGQGSDISRALEISKTQLLNKFYSASILISDGVYNMGENPEFVAQRYGIPIHTIGIGDPVEKKDVVISQVVTNDIVYADNKIPVNVTVNHVGFTGKKVQILLKKGNEIVDQKVVNLTQNNQELHLELSYLAKRPGFQKYRVEIPALEGEFTRRNNVRNFAVKVLESKIQILLLAGEPSLDFKFLKRGLEMDENIKLVSFVQTKSGGSYQKKRIESVIQEDFQLFIFLGFPKWTIPNTLSNFLTEELLDRKKPLLFFQGSNLNVSALRQFSNILPFQIQSLPRAPKEVIVDPTFSGDDSPVVRLIEDRAANQKNWNDLPPVFTFMSNFTPTSDAENLLQIHTALSKLPVSDNYRKPLLISRNLGQQKVLAFLGHGFWRWDFMMWGVGKSNNLFLTFLERSVRWLITREESKQVRFSTDKLVYRSGDQVYVQAQVYTEDYRPIEDASVKMQVIAGKNTQEFHLEALGSGKYQTQFRVFQGGNYNFKGEARRNDQFFGADTGRFSVGEFDIEFQQTKMNEQLLRRMSHLSGGNYFNPENFTEIVDKLPVETRELVQIQEINFWNEWLALIIFLVLLAFEWTIRRRKGML